MEGACFSDTQTAIFYFTILFWKLHDNIVIVLASLLLYSCWAGVSGIMVSYYRDSWNHTCVFVLIT